MMELKMNNMIVRAFYEKRYEVIFTIWSLLYSAEFMEWYFMFEQDMYETQIHLPIYAIFFIYSVFQI